MNFQNDITVNNNITAVGTVQAANLTLTGLSANTYTSVLIENAGVVYKRDLSASLLPTGTEGQMLYNNAGVWTAFSGVFWDDTNSRYGVGVSTSLTARLHVRGAGATSSTYTGRFEDSAGTEIFRVRDDGQVSIRQRAPDAVYGANLITNGTFTSDLSSWTVGGADWTWVSGAASHAATGANTLSQGTATAGVHYRVSFTIVKTSGTNAAIAFGGVTMVTHTSNSTGSYVYDVLAGNTTGFVVTPTSDFVGTIDTVSVTAYTTAPAGGLTFYGTNGTSVAGEIRFSNTSNNISIGLTSLQKADGSSTNNIAIGYNTLTALHYGLANIAIGSNAGAALNNANNCVFIGYSAGAAATTGSYNIAIGATAYNAGTTGAGNCAIGYNALRTLTTNNYNVAIGYNSLFTSNGTLNVAIGVNAGYTNSSGTGSIFLGYNAGYYSATSNYCVAIGYQALLNAAGTSTGNIAIGYQALLTVASNTHTYNIGIGYNCGSALTTGSYNILIGYSAGDALTSGGTNIVIGYNVDAQVATSSNQLTLGNALFGVGIDGQNTTVSTGRLGAFVAAPTARLHLVAGAAAASNAPLKFTAGTNLTAAEAGAMEWDGTNLYITQTTGPTRKTLAYSDNVASMTITNDTTTNATMYPTWVTATSGNLAQKVSSTKLSFNPSTGTLTSTAFAGNLTGAVTGNVTGNCTGSSGSCTGNAASATYASNTTVAAASGTTNYLGMYTAATGNIPTYVSTSCVWNATSSTLTVPNLTVSTTLTATVANATNATNATNTAVTDDNATATSCYLTWVTSTSGNLPQKVSSTQLKFTPSTGLLECYGISSPSHAFSISAGSFQVNITSGITHSAIFTNSVGGKAIELTNGTSNWIQWGQAGIGAPTFTTSSAGTKLLLYPSVGASAADYAIGLESGTIWCGVPTTAGNFKWYGGTTVMMHLVNSILTIGGNTALHAGNYNTYAPTLTGTGASGTWGISISGSAASATTATTATNATNTTITDDTASNATMYVTWVTATTGNLPQKTTSTKLTFNPFSGTLTATAFSGPLTGAVTGNVTGNCTGSSGSCTGNAASATYASNTTVAAASGTTNYLGMYTANTGNIPTYVSTSCVWNATSSTLTVPNLTVSTTLTATVSNATNATNATNAAITDDNATATTCYPTWVTSTSGNLPQNVSSTKLKFTPSTGLLECYGISSPTHAFSISTGSYSINISGTIAHNGIFTNNVGGKAIELTNGTSNWIQWAAAGIGAPTFTTSSAGTKLIFYPSVGASSADYAMGVESGAIWQGVPTTSGSFKWYGGTTVMMTLFNSQLTSGVIIATGASSGFIIGRRDTSAAAWQWYSSAGSLELYDHVNASTKLTWTTGGTLTIAAANVTLNGASGLTVSGGATTLKAAAFGSAANYFAVFTGDPSTSGQTVNTRTASQVRSDISAASTGATTASGLTMSTARLLGRTTASTGAIEEISLANGSNCSATLSAGTLTIAISASPSFTDCTVSGKLNLPTSQPGSPVNGSAWWDAANNKLMIYNGTTTTWKGVTLT